MNNECIVIVSLSVGRQGRIFGHANDCLELWHVAIL